MSDTWAELEREAREAFVAYEKVFVTRIAKRPGAKLVAQRLFDVLASGDEAQVRAYIKDLNAARRDLENAVIV